MSKSQLLVLLFAISSWQTQRAQAQYTYVPPATGIFWDGELSGPTGDNWLQLADLLAVTLHVPVVSLGISAELARSRRFAQFTGVLTLSVAGLQAIYHPIRLATTNDGSGTFSEDDWRVLHGIGAVFALANVVHAILLLNRSPQPQRASPDTPQVTLSVTPEYQAVSIAGVF